MKTYMKPLLLCTIFLGFAACMDTRPTAYSDSYSTISNNPIKMYVLDNDYGYDLAISVSTPPTYGTLVVDDADNSITYYPALDFVGVDEFTYVAVDRYGRMDYAPVYIDIDF